MATLNKKTYQEARRRRHLTNRQIAEALGPREQGRET
jgi:hypothetical protein